ncbi:hypothetical protein OFY73_004649 [Salmonella enterica]|nr:hypothetical protein [Salmonella enterica]EJA5049010.1 hypothetical protein [Salmonella enterica]EJA5114941.1 hypothetical protein [Salmonella enterica]EJA5478178.1 hypothetical protein [Salmonella enterica]EJA5537496.1 hypothetical protein [Salmonella enterica]
MNPVDFIRKNIAAQLAAEGFSEQVVLGGGLVGVDHYRRMSQASRKGRAFDDCLFRARQWAIGQTTSAERKAKKKPGKVSTQPGLFLTSLCSTRME